MNWLQYEEDGTSKHVPCEHGLMDCSLFIEGGGVQCSSGCRVYISNVLSVSFKWVYVS